MHHLLYAFYSNISEKTAATTCYNLLIHYIAGNARFIKYCYLAVHLSKYKSSTT